MHLSEVTAFEINYLSHGNRLVVELELFYGQVTIQSYLSGLIRCKQRLENHANTKGNAISMTNI
jgi:hypothetical protein